MHPRTAKEAVVRTSIILAPLFLALAAAGARADIDWRKDFRNAVDEAEARGVAVLVFLARDT
jgi:hypothetical protein